MFRARIMPTAPICTNRYSRSFQNSNQTIDAANLLTLEFDFRSTECLHQSGHAKSLLTLRLSAACPWQYRSRE